MATPRSLRSFLDATPSDILDTSFQSLIFIPRGEHDGLLTQLQTLQGELALKEAALENIRNAQDDGDRSGGFLASIDAELQRTQVACLETKNATLEREKRELAAAVDESDAKARVLRSEIVKMRVQLQKERESTTPLLGVQPKIEPSGEAMDIDSSVFLEKFQTLESENTQLKVRVEDANKELQLLRDIIPAAEELGNNFKHLQTENDSILEDRRSLQESIARITEQNSDLYEKIKTLETKCATLEKTNQEIMANLTSCEQENKILLAKNHDLADEGAKLEKEGYRLQKDKISLDAANETLAESKTALESEIKALQDKLNGTRDPDSDERYCIDLKARNEKLRAEKMALGSELARQDDELRVRQDQIFVLRRDNRGLCSERADMIRDIRDLKGYNSELRDENGAWRAKFDDLHRKSVQLQKDVQTLQARLSATQVIPRRDVPMSGMRSPDSYATDSPDTITGPLEPPRGPKRKTFDPARQPLDAPRPPPVAMPDNPEKRQKLNQQLSTTYKRKSAIYLVEMPQLVNYALLRNALSKLGAEIEGLRRVFYGPVNETEQWVVKYNGPPKEFIKHVYVMNGVFATLLAGSGTTCLICSKETNKEHDIWECRYLGAEGQERPTLKQLEMNYRPRPPLAAAIAAIPPQIPHVASIGEQSPRSLFERVSFPDGRRPGPPRKALFGQANSSSSAYNTSNMTVIEHTRGKRARVERLLALTREERRALFCRFSGSFTPTEDRLLSRISGGPVEWVKTKDIAPSKAGVGFIDFIYPADAERFLKHAILNFNGGKMKFNHPTDPKRMPATVEFEWSETAVKHLEQYLAEGIVNSEWTRVLVLDNVPPELPNHKIMSDCGGKMLNFWISEEMHYAGRNREVKIEFCSVKEAQQAYESFLSKDYGYGLRWGVEECVRPLQ